MSVSVGKQRTVALNALSASNMSIGRQSIADTIFPAHTVVFANARKNEYQSTRWGLPSLHNRLDSDTASDSTRFKHRLNSLEINSKQTAEPIMF